MATLMDDRIGLAKETTFGTPAVVNKFIPYLEVELEYDNRRRQGKGLPGGTGRRTFLACRSILPMGQVKIKVKFELESKGAVMAWLEVGLGVATVNTITGGSQMIFHDMITGPYLPSATIQIVQVRNDGTEEVSTIRGCTASKVKIEQPEDDIATCEIEFDGLAMDTSVAAAVPTYATCPTLYDHSQAKLSMGGGTLTAPTTTALASGLTEYPHFREFSLELDHKIADDRWNIGTRGQPVAGMPEAKFDGKVELNDSMITDAIRLGTQFPLYCTWTTKEALSTGFAQLQLVVPRIALNGDWAKVKSGETRVLDLKSDVVNDGTNKDLYLVVRTADTTI